ncbi:peptidoglycan DD-metalloendopeptidase family protein [Arenicella xantha]|uniref:Peptidase M23-like protein n=1 Tax=Arenicella xantha TaxID=644221 RepID=A0A395JHA9_9GAMM|nr:peptidoglycan DD-metalloendopeptidase family protein [Arenicella xantha]RBP49296.1 peptidase M23-like protein [Arenicella xantha]
MPSLARNLFAIFTLIVCGISVAGAEHNYPGGVVELEFKKQTQELPDIRFGLYEPVIIELKRHWRVLIGIDLDTLPGEYVVYFRRNTETSRDEFTTIKVRHHPTLTELIDGIEPTQTDISAPIRNYQSWSEIDFSNTQQPSLPLQLPVEGGWSETFGKQLVDAKSGALTSVNAVSFTTTEFANVTSPQSAIVSRVITTEDGISTVFLDHGRGLYSMIEGIGDLTVAAGNGVNAGAVLGKVPVSNNNSDNEPRTIVWQTRLNHALVNPFVLTQLKP